MPRRAAYPSRKSKRSPLPSAALLLLGSCLLIYYFYRGSGGSAGSKVSVRNEGVLCTSEVQQTIPELRKVYGDSMKKVLHVGPETCTVVYKLLKEDGIEAWGLEPYDLDDAESGCRSLVRKGIVRVADIKFPLPYKSKSFSLVIVSDSLDYISPNKLNKTILELARVSKDGLVVFTDYPGHQRAKVSELSKFGRPAKPRSSSWWMQYFLQIGLEQNEAVKKKFELASSQSEYKPSCQIFHLNS